jgi:hypothetical protein
MHRPCFPARILTPLPLLAWLLLVPGLACARPSAWPWRLIGGGYDSATRLGRILPLTPFGPPPQPSFRTERDEVLLLGADNGGLARSVQRLGTPAAAVRTWEPANGGRGFSDALCGGYEALQNQTCPASLGTSRQAQVYGGPPSLVPAMVSHDVAAGGWPPGTRSSLHSLAKLALAPDDAPALAQALVYRAGPGLSVSPDAGRQWFPLAPQCQLARPGAPVAVAVDAGQPGHVVVADGATPGHGLDTAGCWMPREPGREASAECSRRRISWTRDIAPQVVASMQASRDPEEFQGPSALDLAGGGADGWRHASLTHLATTTTDPRRPAQAHCVLDPGMWPAPTCPASPEPCHAALPPAGAVAADRWCPLRTDARCQCRLPTVTIQDAGHALDLPLCTLPIPQSVAVDPRTGFAYASVQDGLLVAQDGGGRWQRFGQGTVRHFSEEHPEGQPVPLADAWPFAEPPPPGRGARLLTMQGLMNPGQSDEDALDLNAHPELIEHVGRLSLAWHPCPGLVGPRRGQLVATVDVRWHLPSQRSRALSGVFVAVATDRCSGPGAPGQPFVFRDTASLSVPAGRNVLFAAQDGTLDPLAFTWTSEPAWRVLQASGQRPPTKLPLWATRSPADLPGSPQVGPCAVELHASAVAPSDDRVLYAWAWSRRVPGEASCRLLDGLWRSTDRGLRWHLAVSGLDPQSTLRQGHLMRGVDLSVSPRDASEVMVAATPESQLGSGPGEAVLFHATDRVQPSGQAPQPWCTDAHGRSCCTGAACQCGTSSDSVVGVTGCRVVAHWGLQHFETWGCRRDRTLTDLCAVLDRAWGGAMPASAECSRDTATGVVQCPLTVEEAQHAAMPPQCLHVPAWQTVPDAPATARVPTEVLTQPCAPCHADMPPSARTGAATPCCLAMEQLTAPADPASLRCQPSHPAAPDRPQERLAVPQTTARSPASGASVPAVLLHGRRLWIGEDDVTSGIATLGKAPDRPQIHWQRWNTLPVVDAMPSSCKGKCDVRAVIALAADPRHLDAAWALTNGSGGPQGQDDIARLVHVSGLDSHPQVTVYASLADPQRATNHLGQPIYGMYSARLQQHAGLVSGLAQARLVQGPKDILVASLPGLGAFAVSVNPEHLQHLAPGHAWLDQELARPLTFLSCTDAQVTAGTCRASPVALGACVTDVAFQRGVLWATVARPGQPWMPDQRPCHGGLTPGLYRAELRDFPAAGQSPVLHLVRALHDPATVAIATLDGQPMVLVADRGVDGPQGNACAAGLWALRPAGEWPWTFLWRADGIVDLDVTPPGRPLAVLASVYPGVQTRIPSPASRDAQAFVGRAPWTPGVFRIALGDTRGTALPWLASAPRDRGVDPPFPGSCQHLPQLEGAQDCARRDGVNCRMLAGVRSGQPAVGMAAAGLALTQVHVGPAGDVVVGTFGGMGAWWLPAVMNR